MFKVICGGIVYVDDISSATVVFEPDVQLHQSDNLFVTKVEAGIEPEIMHNVLVH